MSWVALLMATMSSPPATSGGSGFDLFVLPPEIACERIESLLLPPFLPQDTLVKSVQCLLARLNGSFLPAMKARSFPTPWKLYPPAMNRWRSYYASRSAHSGHRSVEEEAVLILGFVLYRCSEIRQSRLSWMHSCATQRGLTSAKHPLVMHCGLFSSCLRLRWEDRLCR